MPGDPRRRELLGILPRRRRLVPPLALPGGRPRPAGPAGHRRRVPPRAPADRHPAPALRRELDQPQLRHLDRPPRGQPRLGRPAPDPAVPRPARPRPAATTPRSWPGPGTRSTSPRGPTGSGGTATTTPAPWTPCSTTCSASTCRTSTRCSAHDPPGSLFTPISQAARHRPIHDQPTSFLNVKVDGRSSYFEWINAAHYVCGNERGTMALVTQGPAPERLVRLQRRAAADPRRHRGRPGRASGWPRSSQLRVGFVDPADWEIVVQDPSLPRPIGLHQPCAASRRATARPSRWPPTRSSSWPSRSAGSGLKADDPIQFYVELLGGDAEPRPRPARGDLRADRPVARLRADHVAGLSGRPPDVAIGRVEGDDPCVEITVDLLRSARSWPSSREADRCPSCEKTRSSAAG